MGGTQTVSNIFGGSAYLSVATYVAPAAGAEPTGHSWRDVGATLGGITLDSKRTYHDVIADQHLGVLKAFKTADAFEIKVTLEEATLLNLSLALDQALTQVTGSEPNGTYTHLTDQATVPKAFKIIGPSGGTTSLRTMQAWNCIVTDCGSIAYKKDGEQLYQLTIKVMQEAGVTTSTTKSDALKIVDS
jgi:hypothetical protein